MKKPQDLNDAQWQAVTHDGGHLLIVAGPGTGKTHTLTYRIARLTAHLADDQRVLAVTFTNKAADQMKERLEQKGLPTGKAGVDAGKFWAGTFHRFCAQLLRQQAQHTDLPDNFQIALPQQITALAKDIWPDKTMAQRQAALESISLIKSTRLALDPDADFRTYHRFLRGKGLIDFDDILREALILLENNGEAADATRRQYPFVCVDEYQDINIVQNALLKILSRDGVVLTAIGDPDQSIYGFRGSEVKLFHRFTDDFPGGTRLYLNENYRSAPNLLQASGQVIGQGGKQDNFQLVAQIHSEGRLVVHEAATDRSEAEYIAHEIEKMVGGLSLLSNFVRRHGHVPRTFGDMAVLYRLNAQKICLIQALEHLGIPYQASPTAGQAGQALRPGSGQADDAVLRAAEETLDYNVEKVSLLTLHAAKGLEFPVVFITGCEEHLLPLDIEGMTGDRQEERRLFYVGMTRAKEFLFLTRAERRQLFGKGMFNGPSPFLADIEEELKAYEAGRRKKVKPALAPDQQMKLF
ncbi:MAG: ATP-dependent helicase [Candidatus Omnitrophica bacterium]|nr:ATP-dependent helicase [Candidatus Omnitrophota bacterium]